MQKRTSRAITFAKLLLLCLTFILFAASCSESRNPGPTLGKSGTTQLDHDHDGFPHYVGDFKAKAIEGDSINHNVNSFTQGLEWSDNGDLLFESTGLKGESSLIKLDGSQEVARQDLDDRFFGEGLTEYQGQLYQLTLDGETVLVYDSETLEQTASYEYEGAGWGLCSTENHFVTSSGESQLTLRSLDDFTFVKNIDVTLNGDPQKLSLIHI